MKLFRGTLLHRESMQKHTSWRVGGVADQFFEPADIQDLALFLKQLPPDEYIVWFGLGSNSLVRDGGIRGTVISTQKTLNAIQPLSDNIIRAEAGVSCATLARFCVRQGLTGLEFLAGIPGTVGGALAMNAGCHGGETWESVIQLETIDRQGIVMDRAPADYQVGYRSVSGPKYEWFIAGYFQLQAGDPERSKMMIRELLARRTATQPTGEPNGGSVFRNPPGDYAARLIEACGLKGAAIGGACVSIKHANFIVNTGNASATDIENLIHLISDRVEKEHAIRLIPEVCVVGAP